MNRSCQLTSYIKYNLVSFENLKKSIKSLQPFSQMSFYLTTYKMFSKNLHSININKITRHFTKTNPG